MTLEPQEVVLARRQADVNARPKVPDPNEVRLRVDADRQRQLAARQNPPAPPRAVVSEAKGGDPVSGPDEPTGNAGYRVVETSPGWHKLIGPDGAQVGKSVRSEADAWALLDSEG